MFVNYSHLARYIYINKHIHVYLFIYLFFFLYLCHQQAEGFNQHKYQEMNLNGGWGNQEECGWNESMPGKHPNSQNRAQYGTYGRP